VHRFYCLPDKIPLVVSRTTACGFFAFSRIYVGKTFFLGGGFVVKFFEMVYTYMCVFGGSVVQVVQRFTADGKERGRARERHRSSQEILR